MSPHVLAALPALFGSLLLMRMAGAPQGLLLQQCLVGAVAIAAATAIWRARSMVPATASFRWPFMALAAFAWLPFVAAPSSSPSRWVGIFGFRLYVASVVVPVLLHLFLRDGSAHATFTRSALGAASLTALALVLQPDAPQLLAFTVGVIPILLMPRVARGMKTLVLVLLVAATAASLTRPVPLDPVNYVEGVFVVASGHSFLLWFVTVALAALPCLSLARTAWKEQSPVAFGLCLYFTALYLQAPLQATPVPLLGFGAGPILGYVLAVAWLAGSNDNAA